MAQARLLRTLLLSIRAAAALAAMRAAGEAAEQEVGVALPRMATPIRLAALAATHLLELAELAVPALLRLSVMAAVMAAPQTLVVKQEVQVRSVLLTWRIPHTVSLFSW